MTQKVFKLITGIVGGIETIAVAIVTFKAPANATAINAAIVIAGTAVIEICDLFVKSEAIK